MAQKFLDLSGLRSLWVKIKALIASETAQTEVKIQELLDKITALGAVFSFKGVKETVADLPAENQTVGDVWHVTADSGEYVWTGTKWESIGKTVDLSAYLTKEDAAKLYATKAEATAASTAAAAAQTTANEAKTAAAAADTKATSAQTAAEGAQETADAAGELAAAAGTAASNAQTAANEAKAAAGTAQTAATEAKTAATEASTAAGTAQTTAQNAETAANEAKLLAGTALQPADIEAIPVADIEALE